MLFRMKRNGKNDNPPAGFSMHGRRELCRPAGMACLALFTALSGSLVLQSQSPNPNQPIPGPEASRPPDANAIMTMNEQQQKKTKFEAANVERKRQIADDSARLLKLASDLKAEVDKTSKDTLSLGVIRKAEEIEKLAHSVKEKMKLTMSSSN